MIARCELHHKSNDFHTALKDNVKVTDKTFKKKKHSWINPETT